MTIDEQVAIIKGTGELHGIWYRKKYPDVAACNMDAATHYIQYGAALGRNPGKHFDTKFYLDTYPDAVASGLNPLVHYALFGRRLGYARNGYKRSPDVRRVDTLRTKLLSLGFTEAPLVELEEIATSSRDILARAQAARQLALWNMRLKTEDGFRTALKLIKIAREFAPDLDFRRKLAVSEVLCHHFMGENEAAKKAGDIAIGRGELHPDLLLALASTETSEDARLRFINRALALCNVPALALRPDDGSPAYNRLTCEENLPKIKDGPLVTVLIASYCAEDTLPTALRSLQEQTWQNIEVLVVDDCSPGLGTVNLVNELSMQDRRLSVIKMNENAGAYVARNRGLDEAKGKYITLHDADDWSHPLKIETQVRYMEANQTVLGTTTTQARAFSDLRFTRWTGAGRFIIPNVSSFMFRREVVKETFGYWDTVRFSGDSELIRRIRYTYGKESVVDLPHGPFSFQRDSDTSIVADAILGMNGFFFGARREYLHAQSHYRQKPNSVLKYTASITERPYPVPASMLPNSEEAISKQKHFSVVIAADLRGDARSLGVVLEEVQAAKSTGKTIAFFELQSYDLAHANIEKISPLARDALWDANVPILTFGDEAEADELVIIGAGGLQHVQRYLPKVQAAYARVMHVEISSMVENQDLHMDVKEIKNAGYNARGWFNVRSLKFYDMTGNVCPWEDSVEEGMVDLNLGVAPAT